MGLCGVYLYCGKATHLFWAIHFHEAPQIHLPLLQCLKCGWYKYSSLSTNPQRQWMIFLYKFCICLVCSLRSPLRQDRYISSQWQPKTWSFLRQHGDSNWGITIKSIPRNFFFHCMDSFMYIVIPCVHCLDANWFQCMIWKSKFHNSLILLMFLMLSLLMIYCHNSCQGKLEEEGCMPEC